MLAKSGGVGGLETVNEKSEMKTGL